MGTPGVKWKCKKETIESTLKNARGRITYAAKVLNVTHNTLRKKIKEYELDELLEELRNEFNETTLDSAENALLYALSKQDEDVGNALKSSFFILNNKGKSRGYSPKNNPGNNNDNSTSFLDELKKLTSLLKAINPEGGHTDPSEVGRSHLENLESVLN